MGAAGQAFVKGGCGCLLGFLVLGLLFAVTGGHAHADLGGLILLFLIGGIAGLAILAVSRRKQLDAPPPRPSLPPGPWTCASCGVVNKEEMRGCSSCGEARL